MSHGGKGPRIPGASTKESLTNFEAGYALLEASRRAEAERLRSEGLDFTAHAVEVGFIPPDEYPEALVGEALWDAVVDPEYFKKREYHKAGEAGVEPTTAGLLNATYAMLDSQDSAGIPLGEVNDG